MTFSSGDNDRMAAFFSDRALTLLVVLLTPVLVAGALLLGR